MHSGAGMVRQHLIVKMTPAQSRAARSLIDMKQPELAKAAGVGLSTVVDYERARREVAQKSVDAMRSALESAGVVFVEENGHGPGVRLRKRPKEA